MYADDLKIFHNVKDLQDVSRIQRDLDSFYQYCQQNCLYLNLKKCHTISFTRNVDKVISHYTFNNVPLDRLSIVKDIGIFFDCKLLFDYHIQQITLKAMKTLGFITRTCKDFRRIESVRTLYMSYINSVLCFGSVIWNPQYDVYIRKIERVQDKFVRYLNYKFYNGISNNSTVIKRNLMLLSLEDRRQLYDVKFLYKICNNLVDSSQLVNSIKINVPSHNTRNKYLFYISTSNTNYHVNSPLYRCCKSYNTLSNLTNLDACFSSLTAFSSALKSFYRSHIF